MHVTEDRRVGTELAGYRVLSLLGVGGMSVVYLAEDLRLKRKVALKLLASSLAGDESFRERFLAVIGRSASYPEVQWRTALEIARRFDLPPEEVATHELDDPRYLANPVNRCFY